MNSPELRCPQASSCQYIGDILTRTIRDLEEAVDELYPIDTPDQLLDGDASFESPLFKRTGAGFLIEQAKHDTSASLPTPRPDCQETCPLAQLQF